jgi:RNA polymerase sigma factor (TIGR02999 family)
LPAIFGPTNAMNEGTRNLPADQGCDPHATEELLPLVYDELRKLAVSKLRNEQPGQTLQATALVHEAYIRLVGTKSDQRWDDRAHFFAAAAEAMRRILVEQARHKRTSKAGGNAQKIGLSAIEGLIPEPAGDLLALNEALEKLAALDARKALLVKLRFFAGLTNQEAAELLGVAPSTADADWAYAKSWLRLAMSDEAEAR